jgi:small-conductance mechanosensitive channel/CRP-like cAMP-binding protein
MPAVPAFDQTLRADFWITAAIAAAFAMAVLFLRPVDRPTARNNLLWLLLACLLDGAAWLADRYDNTTQVGDMLAALATIALGGVVIRLVAMSLFRILLPLTRLPTPRIVEDLTVIAAFVGWFWLWLHLWGLALSSIVATSAVFTGIVVFSMQETLGNILGGVAVQLDNSIRVGDWVKVDDINGRVVEVRWRYTAIETRNRETVIVPNSQLMKNRFTIIGSRNDTEIRWRRWVWFTFNLDVSPRKACEILEHALGNADIPNVARNPAPTAVLMDFVDGCGRYALRYWLINPQQDDPTDSLVRAHCHAAAIRHGLTLALPREERLLTTQDSSYRANVEANELSHRVAALKRVEIFHSLTDAELEMLAGHLVQAPFCAGATMTHQGDVAHWLYLIIAGEADVWVDSAKTPRKQIAALHAGDIFGEMGMMTGSARTATVTAKTDVDCYRLDKEGFANILTRRPDIATDMSQVLDRRRQELEKLHGDQAAHAGDHENILARIREFFGLG